MSEIVQNLLSDQANPSERDTAGETPLHKAARGGHLLTVEALVRSGADVDVPDEEGLTALLWASMNGRADVAEVLIERGADVNGRVGAVGDMTPLGVAELMGYAEVATLLGSHGAIA
jgi:uncharacterized protein